MFLATKCQYLLTQCQQKTALLGSEKRALSTQKLKKNIFLKQDSATNALLQTGQNNPEE